MGFLDVAHPWLLICAIMVGIPLIFFFWGWCFGDLRQFIADITDASMPDLWQALRGRYWEGEWAELKLGFFLLYSFGIMAALYKLATVIIY